MLDLVTTIPLTLPGSQRASAALSSEGLISNQNSKLPILKHCAVSIGFDKYVLATSPPDFEIMKLQSTRSLYISDYLNFSSESYNNSSYSNSPYNNLPYNNSFCNNPSTNCNSSSYNNCFNGNSASAFYDESSDSYYNDASVKPAWSKEDDWERICIWESFYTCSSSEQSQDIVKLCHCKTVESSSQEKNNKKKVCFADDRGLNLFETKIITESPDTPPILPEKIFLDLLEKISISESSADAPAVSIPSQTVISKLKSPEKSPRESKYNFVPNFTLPSSGSATFTTKLEDSFILLENVDIKPNSILGRVQVRNQSFEKLVKVHITFDEWKSASDYLATHVPNTTSAYSNCDVFSFEIGLPNNLPSTTKIQFSVCYVSEGIEYWDNNSGQNYELVQKIDREAKRKAALEADLKTLEGLDNVYALSGVRRHSSRGSGLPYW